MPSPPRRLAAFLLALTLAAAGGTLGVGLTGAQAAGATVSRVSTADLVRAGAAANTTSAGPAAGPAERGSPAFQAPPGDLAAGPRANGTAVLPSGRHVTPAGRTVTVDLQPNHVVLTRDRSRVLVTSQGLDDTPSASAYTDTTFDRHIDVLRTDGQLSSAARVPEDALEYGVAERPDGELWVSEGRADRLGVFAPSGEGYTRVGAVALPAGSYPWGLALSPDGHYAYAADFQGNTLAVVDTRSRALVTTVATGEYPRDVAVSPDGHRVYVTNWGLYNGNATGRTSPSSQLATPPPDGSYNADRSSSVWAYALIDPAAPVVGPKVRVGRDLNGTTVVSGSLPSSAALSPDGSVLAVTAANDDLVELRDAVTGTLLRSIDLAAGTPRVTGAAPDAAAWSPDGRTLYVALGGRDAVAVLDPASGEVGGLIPTGWYPSALAVSADGAHLYVASFRGLGAGPNTAGGTPASHGADKRGTDVDYIDNLLHGTVQEVALAPACAALPSLSATVARNNGLVAAPEAQDPSGGVVPVSYGTGPSPVIKHVVYILKENRTYDQVFGDRAGTERDQSVAPFSGPVTPNQHAIAAQFASGDNYYSTAQTSYDGHYVADAGQVNDFAEQNNPNSYAGAYSKDPFVTSPENLPQGGFTWNNLARTGISFKIYGEATYLVGLGPTALNAAGSPTNPLPPALFALGGSPYGSFSATYPSQITVERPVTGGGNTDEDRATDFLRDLSLMSAAGSMPSFLQLTVPDDHTSGAAPGQPTPQSFVARNDHAVGRILEGLSRSPFWDTTAVFVTEDDTQDGQDHVDASRTFALVAGGHVRRGFVSHRHLSNLSLQKTVDLLLGAPPTSLDEETATAMSDHFTASADDTPFTALPNTTPADVNPPYGAAANASLARAQHLQQSVPAGVDKGGSRFAAALRAQLQGEQQAGTRGLATTPAVTEHTLPVGAPTPVALPDGGAAPVGTCASAVPVAPTLPEASLPAVLLAAGGLLVAAAAQRRRRSSVPRA